MAVDVSQPPQNPGKATTTPANGECIARYCSSEKGGRDTGSFGAGDFVVSEDKREEIQRAGWKSGATSVR